MIESRKKRVLFVSSSGGHWIQLRRLERELGEYDKYFISTEKELSKLVTNGKFYYVPDASRWNKIRLIWQSIMVFYYLIRIRPSVVLSTGAAIGFFALFFAKNMGAKTIWIDSIANVDEMSMSGEKVRRYADLWLTQWEHLSLPDGPYYYGKVI